MFLSLGRYLCWWTINPRGYHLPSSHCFYHWGDTSAGGLLILEGIIREALIVFITAVDTSAGGLLIPEGFIRQVFIVSITAVDTSAGGLLIPEGIIRQVVIVSITGTIPLLVDY